MNSQLLLGICAIVVYIIMGICGLIPICIVAKKSAQDRNFSRGTERIISFCNCMAGGVFIAMCFLGLLPYAQDKTRKVMEELGVSTDFPLAEFTCVLGFFLIATIEQIVMQCQEAKNNTTTWDDPPTMRMEDTDRSKLNYYKVKDESASEQLLGNNKTSPEVVSPDSPSILKEMDSPRIYQNIPMVAFKEEDEDDSNQKKLQQQQNCSHHQHIERLIMKKKSGNMLRLAILFMAISIHSLFEGMALGLQTDHLRIFHLFVAIVFHEALVAFSVGITMARQQLSLRQGVKYILLFSTAVPLGIILGLVVQQAPGTGGSVASALFQSLAAGIFIHVTFLELVPAELANPKDRLAKIAFHFLGFIALALVTITMGSHH